MKYKNIGDCCFKKFVYWMYIGLFYLKVFIVVINILCEFFYYM